MPGCWKHELYREGKYMFDLTNSSYSRLAMWR